jgi:hypothetical protein
MSINTEPLDALLKLQRLRVRLERNMPNERGTLISTIAHAADEITRLRAVNGRLRDERALIERAFTGRSPRMGGGLAR